MLKLKSPKDWPRPPVVEAVGDQSMSALIPQLRQHSKWLVITGAGVSTDAGIPDYRDRTGTWKRQSPILHHEFIQQESVRRRYWARSLIGWRFFSAANPTDAHRHLAQLEAAGWVDTLVTQNVDGLHQRAGSRQVINLHGQLELVKCLDCGQHQTRSAFQRQLESRNPWFAEQTAEVAPDGDANLEGLAHEAFVIPACDQCGGVMMPDVVFYGGSVPRSKVALVEDALTRVDAVLVVGSSLMVFSGFRFCHQAHRQGTPVYAINQGVTRADALLARKADADCAEALRTLAENLCADA